MSTKLNEQELDEVQAMVVEYLKTNASITNRKLREISWVDYGQAIFFFNRMVERGVLKRLGVSSGTRYELSASKPFLHKRCQTRTMINHDDPIPQFNWLRIDSWYLSKELVILVHGTYASSENDEGDSWWQRGSTTWRALQAYLPEDIYLWPEGPVFHWSGENSESERQLAASKLLNLWLRELEKSRTPYHLVGHSHGGSVIWNALLLAGENKIALEHLQSWATVGTPFLSYATSFSKQLGLLVVRFLSTLVAFAFGSYVLYLIVMFLVTRFASSWINFANTVLILYIITCLLCLLGGFVWGEIRDAICAGRARRSALRQYLPKWLGLWSRRDEAFAGIAYAISSRVTLARSFCKRKAKVLSSVDVSWMTRRPGFLRSTIPSSCELLDQGPYEPVVALLRIPSAIIRWLSAVFAPAFDKMVSLLIVDSVTGNDTFARCVEVSRTPLGREYDHYFAGLPSEVDDDICTIADVNTWKSVSQVRARLSDGASVSPGLDQVFSAIRESGTEQGLVHCGYFDDPSVIEILALHIRGSRTPKSLEAPAVLQKWYAEFRDELMRACCCGGEQ